MKQLVLQPHLLRSHAALVTVLLPVVATFGAGRSSASPTSAWQVAPRPLIESPAQARQEIRRLYQVFDAMYDTHNAGGEMALYLPSFVGIAQDGSKITYAQLNSAIQGQYPRDKAYEHQPNGHTTRSFQRTLPTNILLHGDHATVQWQGHSEALAQGGGTWGYVAQDSTGEDDLIRTPRGWRFQGGRVFTSHQTDSGGLTPEGALALQKVFQAKQLFDQVIAGEQASDDQQQQIRIEQHQHDEQVWRQKHGY